MSELERTNGQRLAIAGDVTPTGVTFPEDMSFDDWEETGKTLKLMDSALQYALGDWLAFGKRKYGEMYAQAEEDTGLDYSTLSNYKYVATSVPRKNRELAKTWSHARAVAGLDPPTQRVLLEESNANDWPKSRLEQEAKARRDGTVVEEPKTEPCPVCDGTGKVAPGGKK